MASVDAIGHTRDQPEYADYSWTRVDAAMAAEMGVWRWDLTTGRIELSERLRAICGLDENHLVRTVQEFLQMVHSEDRQRVEHELELATVHGRSFSWEARITRADGQERTVLSTGSPTEMTGTTVAEMVGVCRDISARVDAESRVGQLERRLADIIANSPSMISIKGLDLRFRIASQAIAEMTGTAPEEIIGLTATELFPASGRRSTPRGSRRWPAWRQSTATMSSRCTAACAPSTSSASP